MRNGFLIGLAATALALTAAAPASGDNGVFRQGGSTTFPDIGQANPYPSQQTVSGLTGTVSRVTVQISLTKAVPDDVDLILIGPQGQRSMLISDAGGSNAASNVFMTFDDASTLVLPDSAALSSGTFKPTDYEPGDVFNAPVPSPPHGAQLSVFNGTDPNGDWKLFAFDDFFNTTGGAINEWTLFVTTAQPAATGGGGSTGGGGGTTGNPPDPDTTAATVESCTARVQDIVRTGVIRACLRSSELGALTARGTLRVGTRSFALAPRSVAVTRAVRRRNVSLALSRAARTAVRAALLRRRTVSASLTLTHVDSSGNRATQRARVRAKALG